MPVLNEVLRLIKDGEGVNAAVANRPIIDINLAVNYMWSVLQSLASSSAVFVHGRTVEPDAQIGMPVYLNPITNRFERGLAKVEPLVEDSVLVSAESARVWGLVFNKTNATLADIVLCGFANLDISAAVDGDVEAGTYYLSSVTPGKLTRQKLSVAIPVLRADGQGGVFIQPQFMDFLDRHVHHKFALTCRPAGDVSPPDPGGRHYITNADSSLPGWLPADDPSFEGAAPAGAVFGYNLPLQPALDDVWPPLPISQASLEWDRGIDPTALGFQGVPLGAGKFALIDERGIWWLTNCYGEVPWPRDLDTQSSASASTSASESTGGVCPHDNTMLMNLWFTRLTLATGNMLVTTLVSADGRLVFRDSNGNTANAGDLTVSLDLTQGIANELPARVVNFGGAAEFAMLDNVQGVSLPLGGVGNYRGAIDIPATLTAASPKLKLRLRILGTAAGILPSLVVTARRVPRPTAGLVTPSTLPAPAAEFTVAINTIATLTAGKQYVEAESIPFTIAAGDYLLFSVNRALDAYAGHVYILSQNGVLA